MRIKFLSFIASFFMVSFVITSCLDDDNNIEYSPDATIHAFELDTAGLGSYKFTIDQLSREIYNEDSLPVHADTIIDKILIKTLTTASGVVTMKDKSGNDFVININDSIDLREPLIIKVWSTEALAGVSPNQTKEYTIKVNVHRHDPDSLRWNYCGNIDEANLTGEQKSVALENDILTYSVVNGSLMVYRAQIGNTMNWSSSVVSDSKSKFDDKLPSSILSYKKKLYATSATEDGKVYESTDGTTWLESDLFSGNHVNLLLAPLSNKITYIKTDDGKKVFDSTAEIASIAEAEKKLQEVPDDFPIGNISYTTYTTATNQEGIMLIGKYKNQPTVGETETIVPWAYMGEIWIPLPPNNVDTSCPALTNPSIIYYNNKFYIFGEKFESFYISEAGIAWKKANKKFYLPYQDWSESDFKPSPEKPEFRGRTSYSTVVNKDNNSIYILFSAGNASFDEEVEDDDSTRATNHHTYSYKSEVWRGRLNQLWFDLAKAGK